MRQKSDKFFGTSLWSLLLHQTSLWQLLLRWPSPSQSWWLPSWNIKLIEGAANWSQKVTYLGRPAEVRPSLDKGVLSVKKKARIWIYYLASSSNELSNLDGPSKFCLQSGSYKFTRKKKKKEYVIETGGRSSNSFDPGAGRALRTRFLEGVEGYSKISLE